MHTSWPWEFYLYLLDWGQWHVGFRELAFNRGNQPEHLPFSLSYRWIWLGNMIFICFSGESTMRLWVCFPLLFRLISFFPPAWNSFWSNRISTQQIITAFNLCSNDHEKILININKNQRNFTRGHEPNDVLKHADDKKPFLWKFFWINIEVC